MHLPFSLWGDSEWFGLCPGLPRVSMEELAMQNRVWPRDDITKEREQRKSDKIPEVS